jgi:hypothetical protein
MGTLKAVENTHQGTEIDGVILGDPAIDDDGLFVWDTHYPQIIDGGIDTDGVIAPEWRQPQGAHDAYPDKTLVFYKGKVWEATTGANVWAPDVSGWRERPKPGDGPPAWLQPTGAHDAYPLGFIVTHNGQTWQNTGSAANVWPPGIFGWTVIP